MPLLGILKKKNSDTDSLLNWKRRLIYQSFYRGCKETDLLLGEFAKKELMEFSPEKLVSYEALLKESDADIYAWITNSKSAPNAIDSDLIQHIRAFHDKKFNL